MESSFKWSEFMTVDMIRAVVTQELDSQKKVFEREDWKLGKYEYITKGRFTFIIMYIVLPAFEGRMHRYVMLTLSGTTRIYENSNVIDGNKGYSLDEVVQITKNYFNHVVNKLNEI